MDRKLFKDLMKEVIREELFGVDNDVSFDVPEERASTKGAKKAKTSKSKLHWMQRPENRAKVLKMVRKAQASRTANKAPKKKAKGKKRPPGVEID